METSRIKPITSTPCAPTSLPQRPFNQARLRAQARLHLSPRKFQQIQQQQRLAVLRGMLPLSPLSPRNHSNSSDDAPTEGATPSYMAMKEPVPWNAAWLHSSVECVVGANVNVVTNSAGNDSEDFASHPRSSFSYGTVSLETWLARYDQDALLFESLERFIEVKLPEALAFCAKMEHQIAQERAQAKAGARNAGRRRVRLPGSRSNDTRPATPPMTAMSRFPTRLRIAVYANIVERTILAMTRSASLGHLRTVLLQARQELFRAVFADYEDNPSLLKTHPDSSDDSGGENEDSDSSGKSSGSDDEDIEDRFKSTGRRERQAVLGPDTPRTLGFFLARMPFKLKIQEDSQKRAMRFERHQVVLRRIVQALYRSLGTVFHAWKIHVRQKKEERLHAKGAQLTAMVVLQRGLVRTIFVEWSKCALKTKLQRLQERELALKKQHDERLNDLYRELFLLREDNARLQDQLALATTQKVEDEEPQDDVDAASIVHRLSQLSTNTPTPTDNTLDS